MNWIETLAVAYLVIGLTWAAYIYGIFMGDIKLPGRCRCEKCADTRDPLKDGLATIQQGLTMKGVRLKVAGILVLALLLMVIMWPGMLAASLYATRKN